MMLSLPLSGHAAGPEGRLSICRHFVAQLGDKPRDEACQDGTKAIVVRYETGTSMPSWDGPGRAVAIFKNLWGSVTASVLILPNSDKFIIFGDDQRWHCPRVTAAGVDGLGVIL